MNGNTIRLGFCIDGNYYAQVSHHYKHIHRLKNQLSLSGVQDFIKHQLSLSLNMPLTHIQIVESLFFSDNNPKYNNLHLNGSNQNEKEVLQNELIKVKASSFIAPKSDFENGKSDKLLCLWMALEALAAAHQNRFDILVLITSDNDLTYLVQKINAQSKQVALVSWDLEFESSEGLNIPLNTTKKLQNDVSYSFVMNEWIEEGLANQDENILSLFIASDSSPDISTVGAGLLDMVNSLKKVKEKGNIVKESDNIYLSDVLTLKSGYGFISFQPDNIFFHHTDLVNIDFTNLNVGARVKFELANNEGKSVAKNVEIVD